MDSLRIVDQVHARLLVRYGAAWIRMWEGIDPAAVKADWAEQVGWIRPQAIKHALDNLPIDRPPNAGQFRAICMEFRGAEPANLPLPPPKRTPEDIERIKALLAKAKAAVTGGAS